MDWGPSPTAEVSRERVTLAGRRLPAVNDLSRRRRARHARVRRWLLVLAPVVAAALSGAPAVQAAPLGLVDAAREESPASTISVSAGLRVAGRAREGVARDRELSSAVGVPVVCWREADWKAQTARLGFPGAQGFTDVSNRTVHLSERLCRQLSLIRSMPRALAKIPEALLIVAHELAHIAGVEDEDEATCVGVRRMPHWARLLGATRAYAYGLAHDWTVQDYLAACSRGA